MRQIEIKEVFSGIAHDDRSTIKTFGEYELQKALNWVVENCEVIENIEFWDWDDDYGEYNNFINAEELVEERNQGEIYHDLSHI